MQCTYPLAGLHRLFSSFNFESDTAGVGSIIHTAQPTAGIAVCLIVTSSHSLHWHLNISFCTVALSPTTQPTTAPTTAHVTKRPAMQESFVPALHQTARYVKVSRLQNFLSGVKKG